MTDAAQLVLGPVLRYADETAVTIWVETDRPCRVEILGHQARTFEVAGHHYGLAVVDGLRPGTRYEYQVALDGVVRWPEPSPFGPSVLRTLDPDRPPRLVFGSCRIAELRPPRRRRRRPLAGHGPDALSACAADLRGQPPGGWPDVLLLIGDQVYADEVGPATRQFIEQRRDPSIPPGYEVADFTEYCCLYREAWSEPSVRWLLSVIPTAMIFDDHDVRDDWNISAAWLREFQAKPWWQARITGASMSYWLYQHLGNLSPAELDKDEWWRQVQQPGDAAPVLRDLAARAQRPGGIRWSYRRTFGRVRVVVIDSRGGRVLDEGKRLMVNEAEWQWVTESVTGDPDHLVLATSLPCCCRTASTTSRRGTRPSAPGHGAGVSRGSASGCAVPSTWNTGRPSGSRSRNSNGSSPGSPAAGTVSRPPRSPLSPVTSTTATWPRWSSRRGPIRVAPSTRQSARRSTTCCRSRCGARTNWPRHGRANWPAAPWPGWPG